MEAYSDVRNKKTQQALSVIAPWFKPPTNDVELNQLINLSLELADFIGDNTQHEYLPILEIIEQHIADYENMYSQAFGADHAQQIGSISYGRI